MRAGVSACKTAIGRKHIDRENLSPYVKPHVYNVVRTRARVSVCLLLPVF